jgi:hypothetical protein
MTLKIPETVMIRAQRRGSWAQGLTSRITGPQAGRAKPRTGISDAGWKSDECKRSDACGRNSARMDNAGVRGRGYTSRRVRECSESWEGLSLSDRAPHVQCR